MMQAIGIKTSTTVNFMYLVLRVMETFEQEYSSDWVVPGYNFYCKKYRVYLQRGVLVIKWENLQGESHFMTYKLQKIKNRFLRYLCVKLGNAINMSDGIRSFDVLEQVIYPDFCKRLGLTDCDFSEDKSSMEATHHIFCSLYKNFFSSISPERFSQMFGVKDSLDKQSYEIFKTKCTEVFETKTESY